MDLLFIPFSFVNALEIQNKTVRERWKKKEKKKKERKN